MGQFLGRDVTRVLPRFLLESGAEGENLEQFISPGQATEITVALGFRSVWIRMSTIKESLPGHRATVGHSLAALKVSATYFSTQAGCGPASQLTWDGRRWTSRPPAVLGTF